MKKRVRKFHVGDVGFAKKDPCGNRPCGALDFEHMHRQEISGLTRSELLMIAFEGRELPDGLILVHAPWAGPMVAISPIDVDWASSGLVKSPRAAP